MCTISLKPQSLLLSLGLLAGRGGLTALVLATCAVLAPAQVITGGFSCMVVDRQDGNPLRKARVVLESPALFQPRVYSTDQRGEIRAVLLPVGNYQVSVSQPGYLTVKLSDLRIGVGTNISRTLDLALLPGVDRVKAQAGELAMAGAR